MTASVQRSSLLALIALAIAVPAASAQVTLRYKFKEGDKLQYEMKNTNKVVSKVKEQEAKVVSSQTMDMTWDVLKSTDKGSQVKVKFGRTRMTMETQMGEFKIDSADENVPEEPVAKILAKVVGAMSKLEMVMTMQSDGEVLDVQVPETTLKQLQELPGADQFGEMFSNEGLKKMFGQNGLVMPKEAVTKGQTWKKKNDVKLPFGTIQSIINYSYEGEAESGGQKLEKISLTPSASIIADPNAPFVLKINRQKGTGTALFDNAAGRFVEMSLAQEMDMTMEVMDMTVTQNLVQTVSVKLKQ
ncbi:MAG: hypothetical protein K2X38_15150 [Gemmataceae bacterium]|nr:hypothetical protein [Gemmataceae bacterium]